MTGIVTARKTIRKSFELFDAPLVFEYIKLMTSLGLLTVHFTLPGVASLKEKRSLLKPLLTRLHREFNVSAAEVEQQDHWQQAIIACSVVSNDPTYTRRALQTVLDFIADTWPDLPISDNHIELI